jgi:hypothetical protein
MKMGYTIIELVIAMALMIIVTFSEIIFNTKYIKLFKNDLSTYREEVYINEAIMFVEHEIHSDSKCITLNGNKLRIVKIQNGKVNYIYLKDYGYKKSIVIGYDLNDFMLAEDNIINNVKDMVIQQKNKTVFITIIGNSGKRYTRCLGIN